MMNFNPAFTQEFWANRLFASVARMAGGRSVGELESWRDANLVALLKARKTLNQQAQPMPAGEPLS